MAYEKKGQGSDLKLALIYPPGINQWDSFTVPMSMREVEPGVKVRGVILLAGLLRNMSPSFSCSDVVPAFWSSRFDAQHWSMRRLGDRYEVGRDADCRTVARHERTPR